MQKTILLILPLWLISLVAQAQFVTVWKTDNKGDSQSNQITIPAKGSYQIAWQEVDNPKNKGKVKGENVTTVTFPRAGKYRVSITGGLKQIRFGNEGDEFVVAILPQKGDRLKLMAVEQWGDIAWTTMEGAFEGCGNMECKATDAPDLSKVSSLMAMFRNCKKFNGEIGHWDVSNVTNMGSMFSGATYFDQPVGNWNVSKVTNMGSMFSNATYFNQPIGNWDVSNVTNMGRIFAEAVAFNQPIGNWDVSNVTNMNGAFVRARAFNQPLGNWDVSSVTDMSWMFAEALAFNQPIGNWKVSQVTNMKGMLKGATAFKQDLSHWKQLKD